MDKPKTLDETADRLLMKAKERQEVLDAETKCAGLPAQVSRSRFAKLATELESFEYTPGGHDESSALKSISRGEEQERQVRFASPIAAATINDESVMSTSRTESNANLSVRSSSGNLSPIQEVSVETAATKRASTPTFEEAEAYGIHTFIQRKSPKVQRQAKSPVPSANSPMDFNPLSTSSPIRTEKESKSPSTTALYKSPGNSPSAKSKTRSIARQFEEKVVEGGKVPAPRVIAGSTTKSVVPEPARPPTTATVAGRQPVTLSQGVHWRSNTVATAVQPRSNNTSMNSTKSEDIRRRSSVPQTPDTRSLREKWEISSIMGTPLHPDSEVQSVKTAPRLHVSSFMGLDALRSDSVGGSATASRRMEALISSPVESQSPKRQMPVLAENTEEPLLERTPVTEETEVATPIHAETESLIDRLNSLSTADTPTEEQVDSESESEEVFVESNESAAEPALLHSVSFYRRRQSSRTVAPSVVFSSLSSPMQRPVAMKDDSKEMEEEKARLLRDASIQNERIIQATRALNYCREKSEFRGSREEVDAQKALLIAQGTRRALLDEVNRIENGTVPKVTPRGGVTISSIQLAMCRDFVNSELYQGHLYYVILLVKCGSMVQYSNMLTSDDAAQARWRLEFHHQFVYENLPANFCIDVEVYALKTQYERVSHQDKYKLKGSTLKAKKDRNAAAFTFRSSSGAAPTLLNFSQQSMEPTEGFRLVGSLVLDASASEKTAKYSLVDPKPPIDASVQIVLRKYPLEKNNITFKSFLSLKQKSSDGLDVWTRYWCVLSDSELKFYRCPEEDDMPTKCVISISLKTCQKDGVNAVPRDLSTYPNSMEMRVWAPSAQTDETGHVRLEPVTVFLAADQKTDLNTWLDVLQVAVRDVLIWN